MHFQQSGSTFGRVTRFQWAPSLTSHNPNPPLPLLTAARVRARVMIGASVKRLAVVPVALVLARGQTGASAPVTRQPRAPILITLPRVLRAPPLAFVAIRHGVLGKSSARLIVTSTRLRQPPLAMQRDVAAGVSYSHLAHALIVRASTLARVSNVVIRHGAGLPFARHAITRVALPVVRATPPVSLVRHAPLWTPTSARARVLIGRLPVRQAPPRRAHSAQASRATPLVQARRAAMLIVPFAPRSLLPRPTWGRATWVRLPARPPVGYVSGVASGGVCVSGREATHALVSGTSVVMPSAMETGTTAVIVSGAAACGATVSGLLTVLPMPT